MYGNLSLLNGLCAAFFGFALVNHANVNTRIPHLLYLLNLLVQGALPWLCFP